MKLAESQTISIKFQKDVLGSQKCLGQQHTAIVCSLPQTITLVQARLPLSLRKQSVTQGPGFAWLTNVFGWRKWHPCLLGSSAVSVLAKPFQCEWSCHPKICVYCTVLHALKPRGWSSWQNNLRDLPELCFPVSAEAELRSLTQVAHTKRKIILKVDSFFFIFIFSYFCKEEQWICGCAVLACSEDLCYCTLSWMTVVVLLSWEGGFWSQMVLRCPVLPRAGGRERRRLCPGWPHSSGLVGVGVLRQTPRAPETGSWCRIHCALCQGNVLLNYSFIRKTCNFAWAELGVTCVEGME